MAAQATNPAASSSLFFRMSPVQAVGSEGLSATRYSVQVTNAPVGNAPYARWYLDLKPSSSTGRSCTNDVLPGGVRLKGSRYVWKNQGMSFVWYHGAKGSYPSDRSYGCVQGELGQNGYPGTVTVVFENDSQHCTATFVGVASGSEPAFGQQPVCALGGYLPLPVPHKLLATYASVDRNLTALIRRVESGKFTGGSAELARAINTILRPQTKAFDHLFPPVWGCGFGAVFGPMVQVRAALETQVEDLAAGRQPSSSALDEDVTLLRAAASSVRACKPSATRPLGAPEAAVVALDRLAAESAALRATPPAERGAKLRSIDDALATVVERSFPVVFGMPYGDLLDRVIAENSATQLAADAAGTRGTAAVVSALKRVAAPEVAIKDGLRKQAKRAADAEKAA